MKRTFPIYSPQNISHASLQRFNSHPQESGTANTDLERQKFVFYAKKKCCITKKSRVFRRTSVFLHKSSKCRILRWSCVRVIPSNEIRAWATACRLV